MPAACQPCCKDSWPRSPRRVPAPVHVCPVHKAEQQLRVDAVRGEAGSTQRMAGVAEGRLGTSFAPLDAEAEADLSNGRKRFSDAAQWRARVSTGSVNHSVPSSGTQNAPGDAEPRMKTFREYVVQHAAQKQACHAKAPEEEGEEALRLDAGDGALPALPDEDFQGKRKGFIRGRPGGATACWAQQDIDPVPSDRGAGREG